MCFDSNDVEMLTGLAFIFSIFFFSMCKIELKYLIDFDWFILVVTWLWKQFGKNSLVYFGVFQNQCKWGWFEKHQNWSEGLFSQNCSKKLCDSWLIGCTHLKSSLNDKHTDAFYLFTSTVLTLLNYYYFFFFFDKNNFCNHN